MEKTYLLIETLRNGSIFEDIHGVSKSIDILKKVAVVENDGEPLNWTPEEYTGLPQAERTFNKEEDTLFQIMEINSYK